MKDLTKPIHSRLLSYRMEVAEESNICQMVGTDGLDRILAISRLLEAGHTYRDNPYLLACHLLEIGIEKGEINLRQGIGIQEVIKEKKER